MQRWAQADIAKHRHAWLLERTAHTWGGSPTRCTLCGVKFGPVNSRRACPKRHKPGRWRLHWKRALQQVQCPREIPKCDATWMLEQMRTIEQYAKHRPYDSGSHSRRYVTCPDDQSYWRFSRDARRYRKLLAQWWALPAADTSRALGSGLSGSRDSWGTWIAGRRTRLLKRVQREQVQQVIDGACTYTFYPDATIVNEHGHRVSLFSEGRE